jgi:hypothetical protein
MRNILNSAILSLPFGLLPRLEDPVEALSGLRSNATRGLSGDARTQVVRVIASALRNISAMTTSIAAGG